MTTGQEGRGAVFSLSWECVCQGIQFFFFLPLCVSTRHRCQVASVVSDSVRPHGLQPTRFLHPWDSPGKNTGVGYHILLQCVSTEDHKSISIDFKDTNAFY